MNRISFYLTRTSAIIVIAIAVLVLLGWQQDIVLLKRILPEMVAMNPMTAVAFILCGFSLLLFQQKGYKLTIAKILAASVILIAVLRLLAVAGLYDAGIDRLLFTKQVQTTLYNGVANHMVPHAAAGFLLAGVSLLLLLSGHILASQWFALPVNGLGVLSVIGYTYHLSSNYLNTSFIPMAFHGGICFMLFSMALLLAKSRRGFVAEITNMHAGGKAARLLLPALVIIPAVLGYYVLTGVLRERFSVVVWVALFVCTVIFMFGVLVWATAYIINKSEIKRLQEKRIADEQRRQLVEYKFRQSQERYYTLMNSVDGIVWEADAQTLVFTFVSEQAERMLGYPVERWINEPDFWAEHIYDEDRTWAVNYCAQSTSEGKSHQFEYRMIAADGRILWLRDIVAVIMENGKPARLSGIMVDITEQRQLEKNLQEKELSQQKLITEITILAQEKERNELGLELHDNINQLLSVVKLYLGVAKTEKTFNEDIIERSYLHLEEAMQDIRKLSHSLVAPSLGHDGLKEALEDLAESVQEPNKLSVQLLVDEDYEALQVDKNKELMLYRIVQEQLNNILKYAKATEVTIRLQQQNDHLILFIRDNGVGFDIHQQGNGIGLKNINSRVNFYSGKMHLASAPGEGCTLEVSIPN
ncbi:PAS domain-containing sensor histidine kinase [Lacibacter sp.]|uniref:PAS domain-containing sensor histidine kinase n=1 Tax=Lacibacter sp. TaxID=1915409 RepID=UPI002B4B646D|nr:PAS domain-containing protein [Lacibacter sp.]HLP38309.1 PAS domain-containing protein [Lacibacter sp.]